ncbi:hypothetical protein H2274_07230 [Campylobacter sp. W0049]|uniref:hypothetical protein n=1 Tax=Campylobacter molothri TaxID=1032242 RepID=UPI00301DF882|nr:hypothetical protein [Campylobacter sp. W0049]
MENINIENQEVKEELELNEELERSQNNINNLNLNLEDLPEEIKETLNILKNKEQLEKDMQNLIALNDEFSNPKEKREFLEKNLAEIKENPELNECIENLKEQEELQKEIKETKEELERLKNEREEKEENFQKDFDDEEKTIRGLSQEEFDKKINDLEKKNEQKLKEMEEKMEELKENFENSIENLLNSKSIANLLKSLYEMDKSLNLILKERQNNFEELNRQREEKLQIAMETQKTREVVIDFIKELHQKTKGVENGLNEMQKEKEYYYKLDNLIKNPNNIDIKKCEKLQNLIKEIDEKAPNFKENYPKKYKEIQNIINKNLERNLNQAKGLIL